jgi:colanic acid/amylovoran biosynthesis glycosyltransferase
MRVLVIADTFPRLSETFIINHITSLLEQGVDVAILAREAPDESQEHPAVCRWRLRDRTTYFSMPSRIGGRLRALASAVPRRGHPYKLASLNPLRHGLGVINLQAAFRSAGRPSGPFDLIHCHYGNLAASCLDLRHAYCAPLVASFHGYEFTNRVSTHPVIYRRLFADAAAIVANSDYSRQRLLTLGCPAAKIEKLPVFPEAIEDEADAFLRNQGSELRILSVARLDRAKGLQYAIRAVSLVRERGFAVRYTIVGDGPHREPLQTLIESLGLEDVVQLAGWMDGTAVRERYRSNAVFILPSIDIGDGGVETQGLVLQEAKQLGLAVLGSDLGGIPESLDGGRAGILFKPGNANDIAQKLIALAEDPQHGAQMAKAGRDHYKRAYSKQAVTDRLLALYARVLAEQSTTRCTRT